MTTRKAGKKSSTIDDYVIAIPSYKRADTLREKSLAVLQKYKIEPKRIYIFVANKEEEKAYKDALDPKTYKKIVVGVPKIGPQRNFIAGYFPVGKPVVQMDDDIRGFVEWSAGAKRNEKELGDLKSVIRRGFEECRKANCSLWGIYPVANGFFMKDGVTTDLRFIIGTFHGCFNPGIKGPKGMKLHIAVHKEDYERCIRFYEREGAIVRLSYVAPKTSYYKEKGGNEEFRAQKEVMNEGATWLVKEYPQFCRLNPNRKSGFLEVTLKDMREKDKKKV
jgi:hypothetical protein